MSKDRYLIHAELPPSLLDQVKAEASALGVTMSDVVRIALREYIKRQQDIAEMLDRMNKAYLMEVLVDGNAER